MCDFVYTRIDAAATTWIVPGSDPTIATFIFTVLELVCESPMCLLYMYGATMGLFAQAQAKASYVAGSPVPLPAQASVLQGLARRRVPGERAQRESRLLS